MNEGVWSIGGRMLMVKNESNGRGTGPIAPAHQKVPLQWIWSNPDHRSERLIWDHNREPVFNQMLNKMGCLIMWVLPALISTKFHPYGANFVCWVLPYVNNKWELFFPTVKFPYNFMEKIHSSIWWQLCTENGIEECHAIFCSLCTCQQSRHRSSN